VEDCEVKHHGKGFCKEHWGRWKRYGNPLYVPDIKEIRKKKSEGMMGKKFSEEHKKNISKSKKGSTPWNLGKTHSLETKKKMSESARRRKN
jgi:hypothetical protein